MKKREYKQMCKDYYEHKKNQRILFAQRQTEYSWLTGKINQNKFKNHSAHWLKFDTYNSHHSGVIEI